MSEFYRLFSIGLRIGQHFGLLPPGRGATSLQDLGLWMSNWPRTLGSALSAITFALLLVPVSSPAVARVHHYRHVRAAHARLAAWGSPTDPTKDAALILDGETGRT